MPAWPRAPFCNVTAWLASRTPRNWVWRQDKPSCAMHCHDGVTGCSRGSCPLVTARTVTLQNIPQRALVIRRKRSGPLACLRGAGLQCRGRLEPASPSCRLSGRFHRSPCSFSEVSRVRARFHSLCLEHLVWFLGGGFPQEGHVRAGRAVLLPPSGPCPSGGSAPRPY